MSLDGAVTHQGRVASTVNNDLFIPARTLVDVGSRYRFAIGKNRATLRVSVSNLFNVYAWDYYGPSTFDYVPQRTATAYLAVDF
ncbi:TonB-dependent receptor [Sphingomonas sp. WKB10]|nr:TonB-dependent receptor [Sphingomonas sp. WKB10]